jgi:hypothetical protein
VTDEGILEQRYRRLLAFWYPWEHRRRYEGEMLAVLMAGARPGRRWPSVRDATNLAGHGLMARLGAAGTGVSAPAWADAAAVMALLAALVLLSQRVVRLLEYVLLPPGEAVPPSLWLRAAGWAAVVVAILAGWRVLAAACAWVTVGAETVLLVQHYHDAPVAAVRTLLPLALGAVAVVALTVPAPRRRAFAVLGGMRLAVFSVAVGAVQALLLHNLYTRGLTYDGVGGTVYVFNGLESSSAAVLNLMLGIVAAAGIAVLVVLSTLPRPVRWRVRVLIAPVGVLVAIVEVGLDGWAYSNGHMGHPVYLVAVQWVILAVAPLLALALGAALVHRLEHVRRMVQLGESTERGPSAV